MLFYVLQDIIELSQGLNYPSIILIKNNWDDFSLRTKFDVYYKENQEITPQFIGEIKILHKNLKVKNGEDYVYTYDLIDKKFEELNENYMTLGQNIGFYETLKHYFNIQQIETILSSLRDCGYKREYLNSFTHRGIYDSLLRSVSAERALNDARTILFKTDDKSPFSFIYNFTPGYFEDKEKSVKINFNFDNNNKYFPNRIIGIIGENSAGKTQLINKLPGFITVNKPIYNRVIHITNSYFDSGVDINTIPENSQYKYRYFGIISKKDGKQYIQTKEEQIEEIKRLLLIIKKRCYNKNDSRYFIDSFTEIKQLFPNVRMNNVIDIMKAIMSETHESAFNEFVEDFKILSSGESILLSNLIKILSCVTYNSVFLLDEPEIHLHPNYITKFMNYLYKVTSIFNSFAIIATHSTFIISEIKSDCVFVIHRDSKNTCTISNVLRQTLGTNAMTLANDIFENNKITPYYINQIKRAFYENDAYIENDIYKMFEYDEKHSLDLGMKMTILTIWKKMHEKS